MWREYNRKRCAQTEASCFPEHANAQASWEVRFGSKAEILTASRCFPLYPRKQTFACDLRESAWCHDRTPAARQTLSLLDHLAGARWTQWRLGSYFVAPSIIVGS